MAVRRPADPVKAAERASTLSDAVLLDLLAELADEIDASKSRQDALWRARRIVYHETRRRDPQPILATIAAAARVSEVSVITALQKPDPLG